MAVSQTISDEEFHRLQMQLIEIRTESYKLKDDNKKLTAKLKETSDRETRLDKELNKQIKLKKALSTLNKSKQSQEYEALLQQTEQEFNLQSQTLMLELQRLSQEVEGLEKENKLFKQQSTMEIAEAGSETDLRRLQAETTVLKANLESSQLKHKEEIEQLTDTIKQLKTHHVPTDSVASSDTPTTNSMTNGSGWKDPLGGAEEIDGPSDVVQDNHSTSNHSETSAQSLVMDERIIHAEAQCQRLKQQLKELEDIQVLYETEKVEKGLLQKALEEEGQRRSSECRALNDEINSFREKVDRKQASYLQLQQEKEKLYVDLKNKSDELAAHQKTADFQLQDQKERLTAEITSLGNALQNSHNLLEQQQTSMDALQKQVEAHDEEKKLADEKAKELQRQLEETQEKLSAHDQQRFEQESQNSKRHSEMTSLQARLERAAMERDDAVSKFEENARASGALLQRVDQVERENEELRREVHEAKELAEKRKKVMDKQAIESQEHNAEFTERLVLLQTEYESSSKRTQEEYDEKLKTLEHNCKRQEQELIRMNHQDRAKTREVDSIQQQLRDLQATVGSLENSRGWFERALKDAEKAAEEKQAEHERALQVLVIEHEKNLESIRTQISDKELEVATAEERLAEVNSQVGKREEAMERLKQDVQDEVAKQRLVEKKGHTALKDLKRQLVNEKKRNERLQEKLQELSTNQSNVDELLQVVDPNDISNNGGDGSSVSSFSFRDFMTSSSRQSDSHGGSSSLSSTPVTSVTKSEGRDLLSRVTTLQQDKWHLEEQVRHLEESAGAMADELVEKTKLIQQYVQHTRTDVHRTKASNEELASSRSIGNRMRSIITGQDDADVANIRELNRKLTRMLEEEMTKNMALKQDLANMSTLLADKK